MSERKLKIQPETKRKTLYWVFKILSVIISCALPIWAICEKFPIWSEAHGATRTAGVGIILILIVLLVIFRKTVFEFIKEKLKLHHAPPITVWIVLLVIAYILTFINKFIQDLTAVFWMGLIGCLIGTLLTFIAENKFAKKKEEVKDGQS